MRLYMTTWEKKWRESLRSQHILPGSKVGTMALTVANMLVGGRLQVYADRVPFNVALRAAVCAG